MAEDNKAQAFELYKTGLSLKAIAAQLGIAPGTVRSWKAREGWAKGGAALQREKNVAAKAQRNARDVAEGHLQREMILSVERNEELTDAERLFCLYYAKTFNASAAYMQAHDCKQTTAWAEGYKLLGKPCVREEIRRLKELRYTQALATADDVLEKMMQIAFADISGFLEWGREEVPIMALYGPLKDDEGNTITKEINVVRLRESDEADTSLVSEVKQGRDGVSIKLPDRMKALEWLASYFEMNPKDNHKRDYDRKRLELEERRLVKGDEIEEEVPIEDARAELAGILVKNGVSSGGGEGDAGDAS